MSCSQLAILFSGTNYKRECTDIDCYIITLIYLRIVGILYHLAVANNITQASHVRLDHVTITLGNLYRIYSDPDFEAPVRDCILASLEKRWAAADQDVFILAVLFNPYIRAHCFSTSQLSHGVLYDMAERVFRRLFGPEEPGLKFMLDFDQYIDGTGVYSPATMKLEMIKAKFDAEVRSYI